MSELEWVLYDDHIKLVRELKQQIESMKCCGNCKHRHIFENDKLGCTSKAIDNGLIIFECVEKLPYDEKCENWKARSRQKSVYTQF